MAKKLIIEVEYDDDLTSGNRAFAHIENVVAQPAYVKGVKLVGHIDSEDDPNNRRVVVSDRWS